MATVLVTDDNEMLRAFVRATLEDAKHTVIEADSGEQCLAVLRQSEVDLVLCDLYMPGKEGLETIREVRELYSQIPIIAMSGGSVRFGDYLQIAKKFGAVETLQKPIEPLTLQTKVAQCLAMRSDQSTAP